MRRAGHARALGRLRPGARARAAGQPPAAVLDGARRARLRSRPGQGLRRGLLRGLRRSRATTSRSCPRTRRRSPAPADERPRGRSQDLARRLGDAGRARRRSRRRRAGGDDDEARRGRRAARRWRATRSGWPARSFDSARAARARAALPADVAPQLATPLRRTRRYERGRRGRRIDMRRTLRTSLRTGGDPIRLARRRRRVVPRRLVMLCDISGSMEPYARAYLQFLTCAAGSGPDAEAFVFATRLTRLTRALASRNPERAIQRAAAAAPDWSSGTRIGDALKAFNDRHGRRGMARGAVVVILSDGWERGDPKLVGPRDGAPRAARPPHRVGQSARRRERVLGARRRHGGGAAALRRARQRAQLRGARRGRRGDRRAASPARGRARRRRPPPSRRRGGALGQRDAGAGQLGRDAERARPEQGQRHAGLGDRWRRRADDERRPRSASTRAASGPPCPPTRRAGRSRPSATWRSTTR